MYTKFKLLSGKTPPIIKVVQFNKSLPSSMQVTVEDDGIYIQMDSDCSEDEKCQYFVDRELDRHRFLTAVNIKAEMVKQKLITSLEIRSRYQAKLPNNICPQLWNFNLATQFRLWNLASDSNDNMLKIILYYQIIELNCTQNCFPEYLDSTIAPHPLSEAKFIRHLVAHSGVVSMTQLKNYCAYLGIPELMFEPTDLEHMGIIKSKVCLLEAEAKKIIEAAL